MTCDAGDIVVVAFPYIDIGVFKRRPALVLTAAARNAVAGETLVAMITTAKASAWLDDVAIEDLSTAGLRQACVVRMRFHSLANDEIGEKLGALSRPDRLRVRAALNQAVTL